MLLPQLATFLAVVEAGSFTAAAQRLDSDKTVVSRRVKALERSLGVRLLNRTTRSLHPTEAGRRLVEQSHQPISDALAALINTRSPDHVEGKLRIASAQSLGRSLLVPVIAEMRRAHPKLRIVLSTRESMVPLVDSGFELGVRVGRMPDSSLIARKLATWRYLLVASPSWVAAHPAVVSPADLAPDWLLWGPKMVTEQWGFQRGADRLDVRIEPTLVFDTSQLLVDAVIAGLGVTAMPPFVVADELAEGSLVRLLPDWRVVHELGIYGVTPHRTMIPARVHVVLDALRNRLADLTPRWDHMTA